MNNAWPIVRLGDHVDLLAGYPFKSKFFTDDQNDIPLVKGSNVHQGNIDWINAKRWSVDEFDQHEKFKLKKGDVVLAMDRPWITAGLKYAWIRENDPNCLLVQRVARLRGTSGLLTPYLRYLIGSRSFEDYIRPIVTGVNVPHISGNQIKGFKFALPPLPTQCKIAGILSAYDDLIENNTRRIALLEEMAQLIYREWFIHFRFPGHEGVKMVNSELGPIPEGWDVSKIDDVIQVIGGGTPSTKVSEYWNGGDINWFAPKDLTSAGTMFVEGSPRKITQLGLDKSSAKMFPAYSVMMTSRATLGVTAINTTPACTNQGFITCIPNERISAYQFYFWIADNMESIKAFASGATFKEITKTTFRTFPILIADPSLNRRFVEQISPIGNLILTLQRINANLESTRALLLPRLISGQVDVGDLEINFFDTL